MQADENCRTVPLSHSSIYIYICLVSGGGRRRSTRCTRNSQTQHKLFTVRRTLTGPPAPSASLFKDSTGQEDCPLPGELYLARLFVRRTFFLPQDASHSAISGSSSSLSLPSPSYPFSPSSASSRDPLVRHRLGSDTASSNVPGKRVGIMA